MRGNNAPTLDEVCFGDRNNPNEVNEDTALTYVAFWAAVNRISNDIAKLPVNVFKKVPSGLEPQPLHPVAKLLAQSPNDSQTPFIFKSTTQSKVLSWGNGYAEIMFRGDGRPSSLRSISPARVTPMVNDDGTVMYKVLNGGGRSEEIPASRMLHFHGLGDGIQGYSPVQLFQQNLNLSLGAENAGKALFENMMRPGAVAKHPETLSDEAYNRLQKSLKKNAGSSQAGAVMLLEEGMSLEKWSIPPNDAQFLESRTFQVQDVARMFNVPPHKIAELSRATFSNVEEQEIQYVVDCLQPWLTNWEQELETKLFLPGERGTYRIKFNVEGQLRGNTAARGEWYSKMFNIGVMSQNEIRALEDIPTIGDKGDKYYVPVNLRPSDQPIEEEEPTEPTEPTEEVEDAEPDTEA